MNTTYNTTTVQESRNRYNTLLTQALKHINRNKTDKTAQEPEEVTATAPTKTTKTRRTKTASPKPLGRDIYHIFTEKLSKWALLFDKSVYHDPEGFALLSDNVVLIESKLDYKEENSGKLIQEDGTESKKDMQLFSKYKDICRPAGGKYAVTPKEIEERIKGEEFARKKRVICSILESDDVTDEEVKIHLKNNKDVRNYVNEQTKCQFLKLLFLAGESIYLYTKHLKRALKVAKILSTNSISDANNILQLTGEAGRIIVAGCITRPEDENSMNPLIIDLTDATPAPEDTAIEETTPAPEATKQEEPIHAPQMLKKMIEEHKKRIKDGTATESIYNADALQTEVLTPKRAKELLGGCFSNYKTYILVDGTHIVETDRPTLKNTLYIDDESPEYKEYQRGNISAVELYRDDMISMYGSKGKIKAVEDNPATLTVDSARYKVLSFNLYRRADYVYRRANPDEVEIYKAAMRASHEAFTKRLDSYIRRYGKKIYVHSYWANR